MFEFLNINPKSFGLDFSNLSLKLANLKKKRNTFALASWGESRLEPGIIEDGEIKKPDLLAKLIKQVVANANGEKIKTKNVVASLPEKKSFFQVIQMPKMSEEEMKTAVPFEAENYIPLSAKDAYIDFEVIPNANNAKSGFENVLVVAFPRKIVDSYLNCLKKSGLTVRALEVESQSIIRSLIKGEKSHFPALVIDFGRSTTSFIFFSGNSILFTSSIQISSQDISRKISDILKIKLSEAEILKLEYGFNGGRERENIVEEKKRRAVFAASKEVLANLAEEIKKHLKYYQTHINYANQTAGGGKIEKIILCGRGANLKGMGDFLSFELKMPVETGNPWVNILPEPLRELPEISYEDSLGYTTALGLALRGARGEGY